MSSELEKTTHDLLTERLQRIGFEAVGFMSFCRTFSDCNQLINVCCRSEGRKLKLTCTLGVRFDSIESLLRPENADSSYPTVSCPVHLLRPEREYYEWEGGNDDELRIAVESMIAEIQKVGLEFFDRFKTIEAVKEELSSSAVSNCLILSPHQRTGTLAAIALARGERSEAESLFADAMKDPRNQKSGKKRLLEELRIQLFLE